MIRVKRNCSISVRFEDEAGRIRNWQRLAPDLAGLVQHEVDHLDGILKTRRAFGPDAVQSINRHAELVGAARPQSRLPLACIARAAATINPVFRASPQWLPTYPETGDRESHS